MDGMLIWQAREFWKRAGETGPFPRDIAQATPYALPMSIFPVAGLTLARADEWLRRRSVALSPSGPDRPLRGYLVAHMGHAYVLVEARDPPDQQRFTVAHEVAHFILDYWLPRQQVQQRLGEAALEVMDGLRPPTLEERLSAVLAGVSIGVHTHLLERGPDGSLPCSAVLMSECQADLLALELLAPRATVVARLKRYDGQPYAALVRHATDTLERDFGIPRDIARDGAARLVRDWKGSPSIRERLGLA